jgi:hypothetical protein
VEHLPALVPAHRTSYNSVAASLNRITWVSSGTPDFRGAEAVLSRYFHEHPLAGCGKSG